jgi:hypothetical protein
MRRHSPRKPPIFALIRKPQLKQLFRQSTFSEKFAAHKKKKDAHLLDAHPSIQLKPIKPA